MRDFVRQLTIQGSQRDDPGFRLRMTSILNTMEWRLNPLPPNAILLVRQLQTHLPAGTADLPLRAGRSWAKDTRLSLNDLAYRAVMPISGTIPPHAQALLFRDSIEAIACMTLALNYGEAAQLWWCRSLVRYWHLSRQDVPTFWRRKSRYVPATLDLLLTWGQAVNVVAGIDDRDAVEILRSMTLHYELATLSAIFDPHSRVGSGSNKLSTPADRPAPAKAQPVPPMPFWMPALTPEPSLSKCQAALLGIGLLLQCRPNRLRAPAMVQAIRRWWQAPAGAGQPLGAPEDLVVRETPIPVGERLEKSTNEPRAVKGKEHRRSFSQIAAQPDQIVQPGESAPSKLEALAVQDTAGKEVAGGQPETAAPAQDRRQSSHEESRASPTTTAQPLTFQAQQQDAPAPGIITGLGGVFYLVNLMRRLDLPDCFEHSCALSSDIGPWGTLEGLARALLDKGGEKHTVDPLWRTLAQLDGREPNTPLGASFDCPVPFKLPEGWPEMPAIAVTQAQQASQPGTLLAHAAPAFRHWLQAAAPYMAAHLEAVVQPLDVANVLATPAHLHLTRTHVDIFMALDAVCLPLRIAGLDFDPGWLPLWGRVVLFHFE